MGGIMKGGYGHMHAVYSSRRRWVSMYVAMAIVCLVFGCGILGLMGLHRLKDRRILNHLIKEKDDLIMSLHHLLQKEREHVQQVKGKTEEMKMKIYRLRSQKTELNSRVLEMQSTISSLRDEQRAVELAYQEKQNEAKLLREQYMEPNSQVKALREALQQKEAEIEDLKHQLQLHSAKVRSVSMEILPENIMAKANMSLGNETGIDENKERDVHDYEHGEDGGSINSGRETNGNEEANRLESFQENRRTTNADTEREDERNAYETADKNLEKEEQRPRDEDDEANSKEFSTMGDADSTRISKSQRNENNDLEVHNRMQENSQVRGKPGYLKRVKGKRWRPISKNSEEKSHNVARFDKSNQFDNRREEEPVNSSMEKARISQDQVPKHSAVKIEGTGSAAANHKDEEKQLKEQKITITGHTENRNEQLRENDYDQHNDRLGKIQVAEDAVDVQEQAENSNEQLHESNDYKQHNNRLGKIQVTEDAVGVQAERLEEIENSEDKEQTDEPDF